MQKYIFVKIHFCLFAGIWNDKTHLLKVVVTCQYMFQLTLVGSHGASSLFYVNSTRAADHAIFSFSHVSTYSLPLECLNKIQLFFATQLM